MIELAPAAGSGLYRQDFAGDTFNTAVYLARCGQRVQYLTRLGDDGFSRAILARMSGEGIDTRRVHTVPGRQPGLYLIHLDPEGERHFSYWRGESPARQLFAQPVDLAGVSCFYFSGITLAVAREGLDNLVAALGQLRASGARVVFDPNYRTGLWPGVAAARTCYRAVLPLCDTVLATQVDDSRLWGVGEPDASEAFYRGFGASEVVVRDNDLVAHGYRAGEHSRCPAERVMPVDTTGAGDAFNAGYLAARLQDRSLVEAIARAQALAATVVQHRGAITPRRPAGA